MKREQTLEERRLFNKILDLQDKLRALRIPNGIEKLLADRNQLDQELQRANATITFLANRLQKYEPLPQMQQETR